MDWPLHGPLVKFSLPAAKNQLLKWFFNLQNQVFRYQGNLHSDNGHDFVNAICGQSGLGKSLLSVTIQEIRVLLRRTMDSGENSGCSYSNQLNTTLHGVMKTTPYELVFGQPP